MNKIDSIQTISSNASVSDEKEFNAKAETLLENQRTENKLKSEIVFAVQFSYWYRFITGISGANRSTFKDIIDNIKNIVTVSALITLLNLAFRIGSSQIIIFQTNFSDAAKYAKIGFSWFLVPLLALLIFRALAVYLLTGC